MSVAVFLLVIVPGCRSTVELGSNVANSGAEESPTEYSQANSDVTGASPSSKGCQNWRTEHPNWLLCDDFEAGAGDFNAWANATEFSEIDAREDRGRITISSDLVHAGNHSLHMPALASSGYKGSSVDWIACQGEQKTGCALRGYNQLFLRTWVYFDSNHKFIHHFLNIGGKYTASSYYNTAAAGFGAIRNGYWFGGTAGCLPNGKTHMGMTVEYNRSMATDMHRSGYFYSYHPNMAPSPCSDRFNEICTDCSRWYNTGYLDLKLAPFCSQTNKVCYWGDTYEPTLAAVQAQPERFKFPLGRWFCLEITMKANTPNIADGEMAYWIDEVEGHKKTGMMWRTDPNLMLNSVKLQHYIDTYWFGTPVQSNKVWFDDVVISTERIGCK